MRQNIKNNGRCSRDGDLVTCEVKSMKEEEECRSCDSSPVSVLDYVRVTPERDSTKQVVEKKENNSKGSRVDAAAKNGSDIKSEERNDDGYTTSCDQENDELAELDGRSKRKERKKKYWEVKKQKKNQGKKEDTLRENFPKHEEIRFGDVVQAAPPKLAIVPKARKTPMSASKERLRLEAIKAYRSRNRWTHGPQDQVFRFLQWQCTKMRHELSFVVRV
uniref:Uncharacterized protein n=1 Tax=Brassica campestris TaxID=3711 RepID=M4CL33_BRACM